MYGNDQGANNVLNRVQTTLDAMPDVNTHRVPGLNAAVSDEDILRAARSDITVLGLSGMDLPVPRPEADVAGRILAARAALRARPRAVG